VRVNVERGRNILMPQTLRDQQDGETKLDQQGRMGMAQAVQANRLYTCFLCVGPKGICIAGM